MTTLWRDLDPNFAKRTHRVRSPLTGEVSLSGSELLDLCAAIELGRVQRADAVELLDRRRRTGKALVWCAPLRKPERDLMDGARGLSPSDAECTLTVVECLARVGVELLVEQRRTA